jgi:hypothetical protein
MNKIIFAASAAMAALAAPSVVLAQGHGGGHGGGGGMVSHGGGMMSSHANAHASGTVGTVHAQTDSRSNIRAQTRTGASVVRSPQVSHATTRASTGNRYNGNACAPGLAKKNPACVPPGQMQRSFRVGQRLPTNYRYYTGLSGIPTQYQSVIPQTYRSGYRYIYDPNDYIYVVDPATSLVRSVINLAH